MGWFSKEQRVFQLSLKERGETFDVQAGETLLQSILARGVDYPHLCRVGSCGRCKSKLERGSVKMLVDLSYVLSGEEVGQGYILPCRALPTSDCQLALPPRPGTCSEQADPEPVDLPACDGRETAKSSA